MYNDEGCRQGGAETGGGGRGGVEELEVELEVEMKMEVEGGEAGGGAGDGSGGGDGDGQPARQSVPLAKLQLKCSGRRIFAGATGLGSRCQRTVP